MVELIDSGSRLEIGEECSGLSMLFSLLAVATAVALVIRRRLPDKLIIVASAVPIAWVVNVSRITSTGVFRELLGGKLSDAAIHDVAGWCAVPLAMSLLWAEVVLLSHLFIEDAGSRAFATTIPRRLAASTEDFGNGAVAANRKSRTPQ